MRHRALAALNDGDLLSVRGRARERRVDRARGRRGAARHDRSVAPIDAVIVELLRQPFVCPVGLGGDHQAGRVLVDAVDDPRPRDSADAGEVTGAVMQQRVDQRAVGVACSRVDDESGLLVDHDEMLILEHDFQRDVLRCVLGRAWGGNGELIHTAGKRLAGWVARRIAARIGNRAARNQCFYPLA